MLQKLERIPFGIRLILLFLALFLFLRLVAPCIVQPDELSQNATLILATADILTQSYTPTSRPTVTPTLTPTPQITSPPSTLTPPPSEELVKEFLILGATPGKRAPITAKPGATITATVQEIVQIQVMVSTTYEEHEGDLVFTWYTCGKPGKPMTHRIGNPKTLYVAPMESGPDCICVAVGKGDMLLDKERIFVDVQKQP